MVFGTAALPDFTTCTDAGLFLGAMAHKTARTLENGYITCKHTHARQYTSRKVGEPHTHANACKTCNRLQAPATQTRVKHVHTHADTQFNANACERIQRMCTQTSMHKWMQRDSTTQLRSNMPNIPKHAKHPRSRKSMRNRARCMQNTHRQPQQKRLTSRV